MTHTAYPLSWPPGWPRTAIEERIDGRSQFRRPLSSNVSPWWTLAAARDALLRELKLMGASGVVLSSNFRTDRTGKMVEDSRRPKDQGVAIHFTLDGAPKSMARDHYQRAEENMRSLTLEAMRAIARHGGDFMMSTAFAGFTALPPPLVTPPPKRPWWEVLGVERRASKAEITAAFKARAKAVHPDQGGGDAEMKELLAARAAGLMEAGS